MTKEITVSLPPSIVYVSGTVNGVDCTWTLYGSYWRAIAERSADDKYAVSLTAVNSLGTSSTFNFTLNYGTLELITDRTDADVKAVAAALARIEGGSGTAADIALLSANKGSYNYTDLNRVGNAVQQVAAELAEYGYIVSVTGKTDWTEDDLPQKVDIDAYLADIEAIRSAIPVGKNTPVTPEMPLNYAKANDIEQILLDVYYMVQNIQKSWYYAGEIYSGERSF